MKISGIYKIQSVIKPERIYIGSAIYLKHRWSEHLRLLRSNTHHSIKLQRHYNKYGETDLQFSILLGCNKEELIANEQFFIDSYMPWFNICLNANNALGVKRSKEWCKRNSEVRKGKRLSKQHRDNISKGLKGHIVSIETCNKISESNTGKHRTEETICKLRKTSTGNKNRLNKKASAETKLKLSIAHLGQKRSKETRLKISETLRKNREFKKIA